MEKTIEKLKDDKHYYGAFGKKFLSNSDIFNLIHNPQNFHKPQDPNVNFVYGSAFHEMIMFGTRVYRGLEKYINETESSQVGSGAQNTPDPEMKTGYMRYFETLDEQKQKRFETPLPQPKN